MMFLVLMIWYYLYMVDGNLGQVVAVCAVWCAHCNLCLLATLL